MPHRRLLRKGNVYRVKAFLEEPSRSLSFFLGNRVLSMQDFDALILEGSDYPEKGFIEAGFRVKCLTGMMKGLEVTLPEVRVLKVRVRTKCHCSAKSYPHYPGLSCRR